MLVSESFSIKVNRNNYFFILLGNHQGEILVFNIPQKGTNISHKETILGKKIKNFVSQKIIIY